MMTRSRFCEIQARRGYTVTNLGLVTILDYEDAESTYTYEYVIITLSERKEKNNVLYKRYQRKYN